MRKIMTIAALAAAALLVSAPSQAYYDGPWCAVFSLGQGDAVEKCDYRDFETCRMDIIAGNRGFCRPNGYYTGPATTRRAKPRKKTTRH
jgi:hypothetical protein